MVSISVGLRLLTTSARRFGAAAEKPLAIKTPEGEGRGVGPN
ncbi:hypothetical protein [Methylocystis parvus]|nr:hypothetical protein [Methylocystis parvus]